MEQFQAAALNAIAAAAGCKVGSWNIDDGADAILMHNIGGIKVPLEVQLKATTGGWNAARTSLTVPMRRARFDELRAVNTGVPSILVVMDLPADQADWAEVAPAHTSLRHGLYWRSLIGEPEKPGVTGKISVSVASTNVFDDHVLCQIMARLRAGGTP